VINKRTLLILSKELPPIVGGAGIVAETLYNGLSRKGVDVFLSKFPQEKILLDSIITFKFVLLSFKFKTIILNDLYFKKVWIKLFRGFFSKRCLIYLHGSEPEFLLTNDKYRKQFIRLCLNAKRVVAVSDYMREKFLYSIDDEKTRLLLEKNITVIRNGVDTTIFNNLRKLPLNDSFIFITAGRLVKEKGYLSVAKQLKRIINVSGKRLLWHIAGSGPDEAFIKNSIKELGLNPYVKFHGAIEQKKLAHLYNHSRVFILLSELEESLGLVYMEASCCGCYSIGLNQFGVREAIINDETGSLVESAGDIVGLLEKNKINRITISEIAQRKFSLDEMCSKIELLVSSS
jgi:L-malate glycosyltransferase